MKSAGSLYKKIHSVCTSLTKSLCSKSRQKVQFVELTVLFGFFQMFFMEQNGFKYAIEVKKKNKTETVELAFEVLIMQPIDPSIHIIYFTVFFIFSPL